MESSNRVRSTRELICEKLPSYKKTQHRFWLLTKTLCNTWRDAQGLLQYPASAGSASANCNAEKHPKLAPEEIALQAQNLSTVLCSKGQRTEKSKRFTWAISIKQKSFANTKKGLL